MYQKAEGTDIIHLCCDRYDGEYLKSVQHNQRYKSHSNKIYEIKDDFPAPDPLELFPVGANKAALLDYLCDKWSKEEQSCCTSGPDTEGLGWLSRGKKISKTPQSFSYSHQGLGI